MPRLVKLVYHSVVLVDLLNLLGLTVIKYLHKTIYRYFHIKFNTVRCSQRRLVLVVFKTYYIYTNPYVLSVRPTDLETIHAIKQCLNISHIL